MNREGMKIVYMSLFDHLVLSPKAMLGALKKEGLNIEFPFKCFPNGDKGMVYFGKRR